MTEIYDYMRLLFARVGKTYSPISGNEVKKDDVRDVLDFIKKCKAGDKLYLLSPFPMGSKRKPAEELGILMQKGFSRLYDNSAGEILQLEELVEEKKWDGPQIKAFDFKEGVDILNLASTKFSCGNCKTYLDENYRFKNYNLLIFDTQ